MPDCKEIEEGDVDYCLTVIDTVKLSYFWIVPMTAICYGGPILMKYYMNILYIKKVQCSTF